MSNIIQIKRRVSGSVGAPSALSGGELAFNEMDKTLYYGADAVNGGVIAIGGNGAFVDRTSSQTIAGDKTFTGLTTLSSTTFSSSSVIDAGGNAITNVLDPVNAQDVATRNYVDSLGSSAGGQITALSSHVDTYFVEKIESDAVVLNGGLTVTNGLSSDTIYASSNAQIGGNLRVAGNLEVLGDTTVIETTTTTTSSFQVTNYGTDTALVVTQIDGSNDIAEFKDGNATALIVKGDGNVGIGTATPNEKLTVTGNISATGTIYADGGMSVDGGGANTTLWVEDGKVGINTETPNEALTVVGNISASQVIYAPTGVFTVDLYSDGPAYLGSTLDVTSAATFASSVSAQGALTVDGAADLNSTLSVDGATTLSSTLDVTGASTFASSVSAQGALTVDGTSTLNGAVTVNDTLHVTDAVTFASTLSTQGAAEFDSTLTVDGLVTINNSTTTTGSISGSSGNSYIVDFIIDGGSF